MHSGLDGYISLINLGTETALYAFNDNTEFYDLEAGQKEDVELAKRGKIRLYADTTQFVIRETSKFRLPSCTGPVNSID